MSFFHARRDRGRSVADVEAMMYAQTDPTQEGAMKFVEGVQKPAMEAFKRELAAIRQHDLDTNGKLEQAKER